LIVALLCTSAAAVPIEFDFVVTWNGGVLDCTTSVGHSTIASAPV